MTPERLFCLTALKQDKVHLDEVGSDEDWYWLESNGYTEVSPDYIITLSQKGDDYIKRACSV